MSLDILEPPVRTLKPYLALHILRDVVPTILDESQPITKRIAISYTYLKIAENLGKLPPEEIRKDPSKWSSQTFYKIADFLVWVAIDMIRKFI